MTAAAAITIFHPPADPVRFGQWLTAYLDSARQSAGFVSARESVQATTQLDWAVEVSFLNANLLDAWLDGAERCAALRAGEADGWWRRSADLVLAHGDPPPPNAGVFLHSVAPGKDAEFIAAQGDLTHSSSSFAGYEGTALFPADGGGQWMSMLRFRTPGQLASWMGSQERQEALPRLRGELTRDFAELPRSAPFGSTVRIDQGHATITPAWKTAMLVLLCIYPIAMTLAKTLSPTLAHLGVRQPLSQFSSNVVGIILLEWVFVPAFSIPLRRWLDPIDGASARISFGGAALIVAGYLALIGFFLLIF
jgi:uncharacterized protein